MLHGPSKAAALRLTCSMQTAKVRQRAPATLHLEPVPCSSREACLGRPRMQRRLVSGQLGLRGHAGAR